MAIPVMIPVGTNDHLRIGPILSLTIVKQLKTVNGRPYDLGVVEEIADGGAYGLLWDDAGGDHEGVGTSTKSQDSAFVGDGTIGIAGLAGIALAAPLVAGGLRGLNSFGEVTAVG